MGPVSLKIRGSEKMLLLLVLLGRLQWGMFRAIDNSENELPTFDNLGCLNKARPQVSLTVSSLARTSSSGSIIERQLEINWYNIEAISCDTVALYDHDPSKDISGPMDSANVLAQTSNFYRTKIYFPKIRFTEQNLSSECLGFWAAYVRCKKSILAVSCIRARPFWMQEQEKEIRGLNLTRLMIPGTHDSGSYQEYQGRKSENIVSRYMFAQGEDIFHQLAYGIRHLDLRVGHYENEPSKFYINHSIFRTPNTLLQVLLDIKRFVEASKKEIIVLDFHRFPMGFNNLSNAHTKVIQMIETTLDPYLIPNDVGYGAKIGDILDSGKRILVAYNDKQRIGHKFLWPDVKQKWGNQQEPSGLYKYLENVYNAEQPGMLWAAMAELTPTTTYMVLKPKLGLRGLADKVNRNVSRWFRSDKWSRKANIVATDFFLANDIIDLTIQANRKKSVCNQLQ